MYHHHHHHYQHHDTAAHNTTVIMIKCDTCHRVHRMATETGRKCICCTFRLPFGRAMWACVDERKDPSYHTDGVSIAFFQFLCSAYVGTDASSDGVCVCAPFNFYIFRRHVEAPKQRVTLRKCSIILNYVFCVCFSNDVWNCIIGCYLWDLYFETSRFVCGKNGPWIMGSSVRRWQWKQQHCTTNKKCPRHLCACEREENGKSIV